MLRLTVLSLAICACANAQFSGLATSGDGSRVYFATALRQKNTTQPLYGKLFTVDSTGLKLFLSRDAQIPTPPPPGTFPVPLTNAYNLQAARVSSDGKVLAIMGIEYCDGPGEFCTRAEPYITTHQRGGAGQGLPRRSAIKRGWHVGLRSERCGANRYSHGVPGERRNGPADRHLSDLRTVSDYRRRAAGSR
jgi:hypothetical protein